jgi:hypothetical protein
LAEAFRRRRFVVAAYAVNLSGFQESPSWRTSETLRKPVRLDRSRFCDFCNDFTCRTGSSSRSPELMVPPARNAATPTPANTAVSQIKQVGRRRQSARLDQARRNPYRQSY